MIPLPLFLALLGTAAGGALILRKFLVEPRWEYPEQLPEFYASSAYLVNEFFVKTTRAAPLQTLNMWILLHLGRERLVSVRLIGPGLNIEMPPTPLDPGWGTTDYLLRVPFEMAPIPPGTYNYSLQVDIEGQTQEFPQMLEVV